MKKCPACLKMIEDAAAECPHCQIILAKWESRTAAPLPSYAQPERSSGSPNLKYAALVGVVLFAIFYVPRLFQVKKMAESAIPVLFDQRRVYTFIEENNLPGVQIALESGVLKNTTQNGLDFVLYAIEYNKPAILHALISNGAQIAGRGMNGQTVWGQLGNCGNRSKDGCTPLIREIVQTGFELDAIDEYGNSRLMTFAQSGFDISPFIEKKVDLNLRNKQDKTALALAKAAGNEKAAAALTAAGAQE